MRGWGSRGLDAPACLCLGATGWTLTRTCVCQGHFVRNWKRRLFVLTREYVYYYDDNDDPDAAAKGSILLSHVTGMEVQEETGAFEVKTRYEKNFNIVASTNQERTEWMHAIESAMVSTAASGDCGLPGFTLRPLRRSTLRACLSCFVAQASWKKKGG